MFEKTHFEEKKNISTLVFSILKTFLNTNGKISASICFLL